MLDKDVDWLKTDKFFDQKELKRRSGMSCQMKNNIDTKC